MTRKKILIIVIVCLSLPLLATIGFIVYRSIYSATINLYFAPKSAEVKIGNSGGGFGDNFVKPGTYEVVISKKGFTTYTEKITVEPGSTVTVNAALKSTSSATANWYDEHTDDYTIAQTIGDRKADEDMEKFVKNFPIVNILPIVGMYESYRVDYGPSPTKSGSFAVFISYQSEAAKQQAIDAIRAKNYNLAAYEVIYTLSAPTSGSTVFVNTAALTSRGLGSAALKRLQEVFGARYPTMTVVFSDDVSHDITDDGATHTYNTSFTTGTTTGSLSITITSMTQLQISIDGQVVYADSIS